MLARYRLSSSTAQALCPPLQRPPKAEDAVRNSPGEIARASSLPTGGIALGPSPDAAICAVVRCNMHAASERCNVLCGELCFMRCNARLESADSFVRAAARGTYWVAGTWAHLCSRRCDVATQQRVSRQVCRLDMRLDGDATKTE